MQPVGAQTAMSRGSRHESVDLGPASGRGHRSLPWRNAARSRPSVRAARAKVAGVIGAGSADHELALPPERPTIAPTYAEALAVCYGGGA